MRASELAAMIAHDDRHWWYRGRRRVLAAVLDGIALPPGARLLDAGCGSGRELDELAARGRATGIDVSDVALACARRRGHADVRRAAIERLPFADATFDLVTCLDVIEHLPDDVAALAELRRVTRPDGLLVVTVPAYQALWSAHDLANRHLRRYRAASLRAAAGAAGWVVVRDTHFNALLLGPAAVVRLARRPRGGGGGGAEPRAAGAGAAGAGAAGAGAAGAGGAGAGAAGEGGAGAGGAGEGTAGGADGGRSELALTPPALDPLLELPFRAEARLIGGGRRIPAGLSLLAVLGRPERFGAQPGRGRTTAYSSTAQTTATEVCDSAPITPA